MKKLLITLFSTTFFISIFTVQQVAAVTLPSPVPDSFLETLARLITLIRPITIMVFLVTFFIGGFTYMTAGDNADQTKKATNIFISSLIGLALILLAPSIVDLIGLIFGAELIDIV